MAFGVQASLPPDYITLNPAIRRLIRMFVFQTGTDTAAHAILDAEKFISCSRIVLIDTIVYVIGIDGGVIPVSEVHELLNQDS